MKGLTNKDEIVFKALMEHSKLLYDKARTLENNGIAITEMNVAVDGLHDCVLAVFEVPEAYVEPAINMFCDYTSGGIGIDTCFEQFKVYLAELSSDGLLQSQK